MTASSLHKRDEFARTALRGILANPTWNHQALADLGFSGKQVFDAAAILAVAYADALIRALNPVAPEVSR